MILKSMTIKDSLFSKGMLGAYITMAIGGYLIYKGQYELGAATFSAGMSLAGIRDAK